MPTQQRTSSRRGFTLVELVVVISILAILSGVLVPRVSKHIQSSRDARRLADIKTVRNAVEQYYMDKGEYPASNSNSQFGGWDVSHDGGFIEILHDAGYLEDMPADPINDPTFHYRYYVYNAGHQGAEEGFMESPYFYWLPHDYDNTFGIDYFRNNWQTVDLIDWEASTAGAVREGSDRTADLPLIRNILKNDDFLAYYLDYMEFLPPQG